MERQEPAHTARNFLQLGRSPVAGKAGRWMGGRSGYPVSPMTRRRHACTLLVPANGANIVQTRRNKRDIRKVGLHLPVASVTSHSRPLSDRMFALHTLTSLCRTSETRSLRLDGLSSAPLRGREGQTGPSRSRQPVCLWLWIGPGPDGPSFLASI